MKLLGVFFKQDRGESQRVCVCVCVSVANMCDVRPRFSWTKAIVVVRPVIRAGQKKKSLSARYSTQTLVCLRLIVFFSM